MPGSIYIDATRERSFCLIELSTKCLLTVRSVMRAYLYVPPVPFIEAPFVITPFVAEAEHLNTAGLEQGAASLGVLCKGSPETRGLL